jgi:hypothetical protein
MGWNDHVECFEVECQRCGIVDTWQIWDDVGKARYVGPIGELVNVDVSKSEKCPHCSSTNGRLIDSDHYV